MSRLTKYMPAVLGYREGLATLQGSWDSLALLSHLSEDGTNLGDTRKAFESLAGDLVTHLETETHRKALSAARARAQVAINILVRNLFERTADISFLPGEDSFVQFAREASDLRHRVNQAGPEAQSAAAALAAATRSMQMRLEQFVSKYSVYQNVIFISPEGEVLLQLEHGGAPAMSRDPLIAATFASTGPYVESFHYSDLMPNCRRALIYSRRIVCDGRTLGILCLCFRLEDECERIFRQLRSEADWTVLGLLDANGEVIASSDNYQVPVGARVPTASSDACNVVRFAGREFLAVTCTAQPYQGYAGPGWRGQVMVPLERVFEPLYGTERLRCDTEVLADLRTTATTFSAALREIPQQADAIQRDLNRSVWNGSVRLSSSERGQGVFAKALLREISNTGRKTQEVFERSIEELHETVVSSLLHDCQFRASLAVELLARSLFERANDCRWWALDATLIGRLSAAADGDEYAAGLKLRRINELYTAYHSITLFDHAGNIVAISTPELQHLLGTRIDEPWARQTLSLTGPQEYCASRFEPSALYGGRPTLVFAAPVRSYEGRLIGGVAVVFDTGPQLSAMLHDVLPKDAQGAPLPGCAALFVDRDLRVVSATGASVDAGCLGLDSIKANSRQGEARVARIVDAYSALGIAPDTGYREYAGLGGYAVVLMPIGKVSSRRANPRGTLPRRTGTHQDSVKREDREFATFSAGESWYALPISNVIEALDARALQPMPATGKWCAGFTMFEGEPIAVVDTARLLGVTHIESPKTVIVIRIPGHRRPFGILVETLGDIAEVPENRLLPIIGLGTQSTVMLVDYAIEAAHPKDPVVMVLNAERLVSHIQGQSIEASRSMAR